MKVGDLVMKKSYGRTWDNGSQPVRVVARLIRKHEPRLHGHASYYIALDDDPNKARDPGDYFVVSEA
jgi:hypothetical protein